MDACGPNMCPKIQEIFLSHWNVFTTQKFWFCCKVNFSLFSGGSLSWYRFIFSIKIKCFMKRFLITGSSFYKDFSANPSLTGELQRGNVQFLPAGKAHLQQSTNICRFILSKLDRYGFRGKQKQILENIRIPRSGQLPKCQFLSQFKALGHAG